MEKNCLVTKLKSVIDNDNLLKIGEFRYRVNNNMTYVPLGTAQAQTLTIISGNLTINGESSYLLNSVTPAATLVGTGVLSIPNKYALTLIRGDKTNFDNQALSSLYNLTDFIYEAKEAFDINDFNGIKNLDLIQTLRIICESNNMSGNISTFKDVKYRNSLQSLSIEKAANIQLTGNLKYLGCFVNCSQYGVTLVKTSISGNIEDFVAVKRGSGKTTGSVTFTYMGDNGLINYKGSPIANAQSNTISWTDSTITYNDDTINNNSVIIL